MKKYIKPAIAEVKVDTENLMLDASMNRSYTITDSNDIGANDLNLDWDEE